MSLCHFLLIFYFSRDILFLVKCLGGDILNEIYTRFVELRKDQNLTQTEFASKLNLTRSAIANYEQGRRPLSDRTVADICRVFNVNEEWLRTGSGDMYRPPIEKGNELVELVADLVQTDDDFSKQFIIEYLRLSEDEKEVIKKIMRNVKDYL